MDCGSLTNPANGQVDHTTGTAFGHSAVYSCNTGYSLVGNSTRTCQVTGNWSLSAPTCQGVYPSNPLLPNGDALWHCMTLLDVGVPSTWQLPWVAVEWPCLSVTAKTKVTHLRGLKVAYWLKHWTADQKVQGSSPTCSRDLFLFWVHSALPQKLSRRFTFVSFRGDIKPSVPGNPLKLA